MIEFLIAGGYPVDGKPSEVAYPDPSNVAEEDDKICFLNLPTLVELKIASGMTGQDPIRDLVDVLE